jgi:hypothetical protein
MAVSPDDAVDDDAICAMQQDKFVHCNYSTNAELKLEQARINYTLICRLRLARILPVSANCAVSSCLYVWKFDRIDIWALRDKSPQQPTPVCFGPRLNFPACNSFGRE